MSIDDYIAALTSTINACPLAANYQFRVDRKTKEIAFISASIYFRDGSTLDVKEFVEETMREIEKYKYAYNYRRDSHMIFRYDNAPDPRAKKLPSFPHHKHVSDEEIVPANMPTLSDVLNEISLDDNL